ncbi:MAG: hypothetical protein ABIH49_02115 [archaeon]
MYKSFKELGLKVMDNLPPRREFEDLEFEVIDDLHHGERHEFLINSPTFIEQQGPLRIVAFAPVVIKGGVEKLEAYIGASSVIKGSTPDTYVVAAPNLELLTEDVSVFHEGHFLEDRGDVRDTIHLDAPHGNKGIILVSGAYPLNFEYDIKGISPLLLKEWLYRPYSGSIARLL